MNDTRANQWVPVSERLPEHGRFYVVVLQSGQRSVAYRSPFRWEDETRDRVLDVDRVTHWMDLPEPPEPPKPADTFEAWWGSHPITSPMAISVARDAWNAAKEHYAKSKDYHRGFEDSVIALESMVDRIFEGKEDGTGKLEIPELEKLRRVLLEHFKPLPDFETWAKAHCADGPYLAVYPHPFTKQLIHIDNARGIWNAAQGKPEA